MNNELAGLFHEWAVRRALSQSWVIAVFRRIDGTTKIESLRGLPIITPTSEFDEIVDELIEGHAKRELYYHQAAEIIEDIEYGEG